MHTEELLGPCRMHQRHDGRAALAHARAAMTVGARHCCSAPSSGSGTRIAVEKRALTANNELLLTATHIWATVTLPAAMNGLASPGKATVTHVPRPSSL